MRPLYCKSLSFLGFYNYFVEQGGMEKFMEITEDL